MHEFVSSRLRAEWGTTPDVEVRVFDNFAAAEASIRFPVPEGLQDTGIYFSEGLFIVLFQGSDARGKSAADRFGRLLRKHATAIWEVTGGEAYSYVYEHRLKSGVERRLAETAQMATEGKDWEDVMVKCAEIWPAVVAWALTRKDVAWLNNQENVAWALYQEGEDAAASVFQEDGSWMVDRGDVGNFGLAALQVSWPCAMTLVCDALAAEESRAADKTAVEGVSNPTAPLRVLRFTEWQTLLNWSSTTWQRRRKEYREAFTDVPGENACSIREPELSLWKASSENKNRSPFGAS